MKKLVFYGAYISFIVLFSNCYTWRIMDFTILLTKDVELSKFASLKRDTNRVTGEDKKPIIILIPIGKPSVEKAIDRAIESVPGAIALLDGVLTY